MYYMTCGNLNFTLTGLILLYKISLNLWCTRYKSLASVLLCVPERSYQKSDATLLKKLRESDNTRLLNKI